MRKNLKKARNDKGMTQQVMADALGITLRYYKALESGERLGGIEHWDKMEDLLSVHQRVLREISRNHPDREDNPLAHQGNPQF